MNENESLKRFGLRPAKEDLPVIRDVLAEQAQRERESQGSGDTELMKLCCVQLFNSGELEDILAIWRAKTASMDGDGAIDVQLLCGAGLERTKAYLVGQSSEEARSALNRVLECEAAGDFKNFSVADLAASYRAYYENS